jgi:hypothetical protein
MSDAQNEPRDPLEAQLAALRPRTDRIDRDRLMFLAGRASVSPSDVVSARRLRMWQALAGAMAVTTAALVAVLALRPATQAVAPSLHDAVQVASDAAEPVASPSNTAEAPQAKSPATPNAGTWLQFPLFSAFACPPTSRASTYLCQLETMLNADRDGRAATGDDDSTGNSYGPAPLSNQELLKSLLDEPPARRSVPNRSSAHPHIQGANT